MRGEDGIYSDRRQRLPGIGYLKFVVFNGQIYPPFTIPTLPPNRIDRVDGGLYLTAADDARFGKWNKAGGKLDLQ